MTYTDLIKAVSTDANCSQTLVKQIIETLSNHVAREVRAEKPAYIKRQSRQQVNNTEKT